ncbi:MAG: sarcosine oxidase subunit alpha family protein [Hyphomicrobiaceae bacterium]
MSGFRTPTGGRIDRTRPIAFSFDGRPVIGYRGDTLASALVAAGVTLTGRSFKYHRPRGIVTAGPEEPAALVTLGEGARREPNLPATTVELVDGLVAESQNRWPSLGLDLMAVNQLAAPVLAAGFYYKTFMGPGEKAWMGYEPFIRRAAGLGRAGREPDPDRYEGRHAFADIAVVGSGPAGLAAALAAGRSGARVLLIEQDFEAGGSLLAEPEGGVEAAWRARVLGEIASLPNVTLALRTTAFGLYDHMTLGLVERRDHERADPASGRARQVVVTLRAKAVVLATGAIERPLVFNNNDRPGVMLASAARTYLNRFGAAVGRRAVIVTNNDSAYRTAFDLADAGVAVAVADLRRGLDEFVRARALAKNVELLSGIAVVEAAGRGGVKQAVLAEYRGEGETPAFLLERREADTILVSGGWTPAVHLASHLGGRPHYREDIAAFVPGRLPAGIVAAGAAIGTFGLVSAIAEGEAAGRLAAGAADARVPSGSVPRPEVDAAETGDLRIEPAWHIRAPKKGKAFVDLQNDVTTSDVALAYREGYRSVEHLKRYTTLGMGTDQGKTSNVNALALMAGHRSVAVAEAGTTTFRPPFTPVAIGALAGRGIGRHFRPVRRSPLHDWHVRNGGEFIEAGPWLRAWYYHWAGATPADAYVREMEVVRRGVGIADVSTLGKIEVAGPDAAELLERVYVNGFRKLPVGKARYGVMLGDDGIVLDDGTTTRLSETSFFMTTTTAMAGEVMSWLEFLIETAWTDLDVHLTSLTDEWAGMAVAGPRSRDVLARALPGFDLSGEALGFMGAVDGHHEGVPVRVLRLSFSGELAYEVYCPADYGIALFEHILKAGEPEGIRPYGLEALASLRIEKGHVAGLELDHRNTLGDLGLARMASKAKPFVGRPLAGRPAHAGKDRWSLVGLESLEPGAPVRGGSILFAASDTIRGHGRGYITSVTWSTELNRTIALGLYEGGLAHEGEEIIAAFPLKDEQVRLRIVSPHFIDREGKRLNA